MVRASDARPQPSNGKQQRAASMHLQMYRHMVITRELSDRMFTLNRQGRAAFAVTGQGHEAAQIGSAYAIKKGTDWVLPYYRDIGVAITIGQTPRDLLLAMLSKAEDISSGGRNMPSHFSDPKLRIVAGSAPVATQLRKKMRA